MAILGAHMSVAGGFYKAVDAGAAVGCDCVQIFSKNNNQWLAKPIVPADADRFRAAMAEQKLHTTLCHASYLINLASPDSALWKKSIDAMIVELQRAEVLGVPAVVVHPGAYTTSSETAGLKQISMALDEIMSQTRGLNVRCLLENTAGQGSNLGFQFEQLGTLLQSSRWPERLGVCIDTCHAFAAGYPLAPHRSYLETIRSLQQSVGLDAVCAFHLNDSKQPCGSRKDRHAHIGRGEMGLEPFRSLINDRRFRRIPMCLETAKGMEQGRDWDLINLEVLRSLVRK